VAATPYIYIRTQARPRPSSVMPLQHVRQHGRQHNQDSHHQRLGSNGAVLHREAAAGARQLVARVAHQAQVRVRKRTVRAVCNRARSTRVGGEQGKGHHEEGKLGGEGGHGCGLLDGRWGQRELGEKEEGEE
jgi:hypothetical protein